MRTDPFRIIDLKQPFHRFGFLRLARGGFLGATLPDFFDLVVFGVFGVFLHVSGPLEWNRAQLHGRPSGQGRVLVGGLQPLALGNTLPAHSGATANQEWGNGKLENWVTTGLMP